MEYMLCFSSDYTFLYSYKGRKYMILTKKRFVISSSFILIASLCTITLLTKQNTKLDSSPSNIEKETITEFMMRESPRKTLVRL